MYSTVANYSKPVIYWYNDKEISVRAAENRFLVLTTN